MPPLNALRAFEAAARHLSFKLAGQELHVTAGAISRHVAHLEEFLGEKLFVRHHKKVVMTPKGVAYLHDVQPALQHILAATNELVSQTDQQVLRLRVPPTFAQRWLVPRLATFNVRHPDLSVRITTSHDPVGFATDEFDAGVYYGEEVPMGLVGEVLVPEHLVPICRASHPAAAVQAPEALAQHMLLHSFRRPDDWPHWFERAGLSGVQLKRKMVFENSSLTYQGAFDGLGVAIAQLSFVSNELISGVFVAPTEVTYRSAFAYFLVYPKEKATVRKLRALHAWLGQEAREGRQICAALKA